MAHETPKDILEPIGVVGIGCRSPGRANDPEAFWTLLERGVDAITEVPADRWNLRAFYDPDPSQPGKTYSRWGGFVEGIDRFDPHVFGTHSLRRTKATLIYRRTGNLRAVQLLLGHTKIESTVRYLGIEVDDALAIAEGVDI